MKIEEPNNSSGNVNSNGGVVNSTYIQMANLTSGSGNVGSAPINACSSFRTNVKPSDIMIPIDFNSNDGEGSFRRFNSSSSSSSSSSAAATAPSNAVYNCPWDFKLKTNPLLLQIQSTQSSTSTSGSSTSTSTSTSSSSSCSAQVPPPLPSAPPPSQSTLKKPNVESQSNDDSNQHESQYCAPWDLKMQEEMLKLMASQGPKSTDTTETINDSTSSHLKRNSSSNSSIKRNSSLKTTTVSCDVTSEPASEYSPPWEHKQSILLQSIAASASDQRQQQQQQHSTSTLKDSADQQMPNMFNKLNVNRLSTRSNPSSSSSSSSTRSSTSSLSTCSPPSVPPSIPPPLPPPPLVPPPPLPAPLAQSSSSNSPADASTSKQCPHHCLVHQHSFSSSSSQHQHQHQHQQQSPHMSHRMMSQSNFNNAVAAQQLISNNSAFSIIANSANPTGVCNSNTNSLILNSLLNKNTNQTGMSTSLNGGNNSNVLLMSSCHGKHISGTSIAAAAYMNDTAKLNKFGSWGSNHPSANMAAFDTLTSSVISHNLDDSVPILRQNRSGSSHHFPYPAVNHGHFQTLQNTPNNHNGDELQMSAMSMPMAALMFSQTSSLPMNSHHTMVDANNCQIPAYMAQLEKQGWFHGKITRKQAENLLANRPIGCFLVRQSESGNLNDFSLSLVSKGGCVHMRICMKNGEFILGQCSQPFCSIIKMIEHYNKVEVPIKGAQHVKLSIPILRN